MTPSPVVESNLDKTTPGGMRRLLRLLLRVFSLCVGILGLVGVGLFLAGGNLWYGAGAAIGALVTLFAATYAFVMGIALLIVRTLRASE